MNCIFPPRTSAPPRPAKLRVMIVEEFCLAGLRDIAFDHSLFLAIPTNLTNIIKPKMQQRITCIHNRIVI